MSFYLFHVFQLKRSVGFFFNDQLVPINWASLVAQLVKSLPAMQESLQFLGWEDPVKKR